MSDWLIFPGPVPAICPDCGKPDNGTIAIRRMNTAYTNDYDNSMTSCDACYEEQEEYWKERWEDYYRGLL